MRRFSFHTGAMKANLLAAAALVTGALALASCAEQGMIPAPQQASAPPPRAGPTSSPARAPAASWIDNPATPGDWRWSQEGGQSVARFAGGRLVLRCDPATRAVRIERSEAGAPIASAAAIRIVTPTMTRQVSAVPRSGIYAADVAARDPLLDAMAFAKGRFAVEVSGLPTLYVPSWTEVSRVVEDCR